ncbi:4'-phosphopantetheinyl transferase superfamily protein [Peribacillus simplex]|uniref:4'-phosphopantetheinyl transferase family protein n=1 Tax=Peribacillus simplex TaxID=1478 RepID=UPI00298DF029|nr:4'-phosphopantetheinyl transferase superfamily protein [Peribacillus simplex]MDW7614149.1 4'-phosphopantetheinyl transferase superfamily protein [Peribacillus simplex]
MCEIYGVNLSNSIDSSTFQLLLQLLPFRKAEKINKFLHFEDAQRGLVADLLIRFIIAKKGMTNGECQFNINAFGKPFLKNFPKFEFNLSHSEEWVVCAIDTAPVGIDVEAIKPIDLQVANHFFTEKECHYISSSPELQESRFYEVWTLKESYIKAVGQGLTIPLNSFSIVHTNSSYQLELESGNFLDDQTFYFKQMALDPHYKLAICTQNNNFPFTVTHVPLQDLVSGSLKNNST